MLTLNVITRIHHEDQHANTNARTQVHRAKLVQQIRDVQKWYRDLKLERKYVVFERGVRECHFSCLCYVPQITRKSLENQHTRMHTLLWRILFQSFFMFMLCPSNYKNITRTRKSTLENQHSNAHFVVTNTKLALRARTQVHACQECRTDDREQALLRLHHEETSETLDRGNVFSCDAGWCTYSSPLLMNIKTWSDVVSLTDITRHSPTL